MSDTASNPTQAQPLTPSPPQTPTQTQTDTPVQPAPDQPTRLRYRAAFQQIEPAAEKVETKDLLQINIDVTTAVATATGALPEIMALRERASKLPEFDIKNFDLLEAYALASMHVQGEYVAASTPPQELLQLNDQGVALRDVLHSDASALAKRGLMNGSKLSTFKVSPGYKVLAEDLVGLSSLLRHSWDNISSKTAITMAELDQAEDLSDKLMTAVGAREQAPAVLADVAVQRQRVFTLMVEAYDQVRRALSFLRWEEDDLETIAPSLYSVRASRKKADPQPTPPAPTPPVTPVTPGAPALPGTGAPLTTPSGAGATQSAAATTAPGLPGSKPFAS